MTMFQRLRAFSPLLVGFLLSFTCLASAGLADADTAPGLYTVNGFATDAAGNTGGGFTTFGVVDPNDMLAAELASYEMAEI